MTNDPNRWRRRLIATAGLMLMTLAIPVSAMAQTTDPAGGGPAQHGGHRHGARPQAANPGSQNTAGPVVKPEPLQRLDAGALLCQTEQELQLHQAAIIAKLDGSESPEPGGCHVVQSMTAVSVVDRHGPARTEVRTATQTGWTDSMVRNP